MDKIIGRHREFDILKSLQRKAASSLVVFYGRRRIGKSFLANVYSQLNASKYIQLVGLAPAEGQTNQDQLDSFMQQLSEQTSLPLIKLANWQQAFDLMASQIKDKEKTILFLDEISWMGQHDKNFQVT